MKKVRLRGPVQIHVLYPEPDFGIESIENDFRSDKTVYHVLHTICKMTYFFSQLVFTFFASGTSIADFFLFFVAFSPYLYVCMFFSLPPLSEIKIYI